MALKQNHLRLVAGDTLPSLSNSNGSLTEHTK